MAGLMGGGKSNASNSPKYTGMQLQTAAYGVVVSVIYGTTRVGWNLADYVNFQPHQGSSGKGGEDDNGQFVPSMSLFERTMAGGLMGKGGVIGGGGKGSATTTYSASILGVICEGPISGIYSSWVSQTHSAGTPNFSIFLGSIAQTPWSYLTTSYPTHALTYSGFCTAGAQNYNLGSSANLPNINWEVQGFFQGTAPGTYGGNGCVSGGDADPSKIIPDMLSNSQYGIGFPASRIGQVSSYGENHTIPAGATYTVTINNPSGFLYNINVVDGAGNLYTCVASSPGYRQYSFNAATGVYTFNSANASTSISIRYAGVSGYLNYQNFVLASGLWVSPAYSEQGQISTLLDDLALATFSEFVWSSGVLQIVPRGTQAITANGYSFTPNTTPLFNLSEDDFMENASPTGTLTSAANTDPVIVSRTRASDQLNVIRIEAFDRANQYAPTVVEATDQALIDAWGRRPGASKSLHMFCDINAANVSAQLQLQDEYIRNGYSYQLDARYGLLDPMDLVELTEPQYPGLTNAPCRVMEMTENDDGTISVTAEEYPGTIGTVPLYNLNTGQGYIQNFNVDPGNAATPIMMDIPVQQAGALGLETWLATCSSAGNLNWGGCDVYVSTDNINYYKQGTLTGPSRMGTLSATFPTGTDPDTVNTCSANLATSFGTLTAGATTDADNNATLCYVGGEYISYSSITLTSTYNYNLSTYIRRGVYNSTIQSHASGSQFVRLDSQVFKMFFQPTDIGRTIYVKLVSFNIYGGGYQSLSSVTAYSHTIVGPPPPAQVQGFTAQQNGAAMQLQWTDLIDVSVKGYDILYGPINGGVGTATLLTEASRQTAETTVGIPPGSWTIYIRARNIANLTGPATSVNVIVTNTNVVISFNEYDPDFLGTKVGFNFAYQGYLVPATTGQASSYSNAALFTKTPGTPSQYVNPTYTPNVIDEGIIANCRVFFAYSMQDMDLSGNTPSVTTYLDAYQSVDPGTFNLWSVGFTNSRYFIGRIALNTTLADGYITQFAMTVDAPLATQTYNGLAVANTGTTITFATLGLGPFHSPPNIQVTPSDGVGTGGGASNITTTGATIQEFSGTTLISGTVNLTVIGN